MFIMAVSLTRKSRLLKLTTSILLLFSGRQDQTQTNANERCLLQPRRDSYKTWCEGIGTPKEEHDGWSGSGEQLFESTDKKNNLTKAQNARPCPNFLGGRYLEQVTHPFQVESFLFPLQLFVLVFMDLDPLLFETGRFANFETWGPPRRLECRALVYRHEIGLQHVRDYRI